MGVREIRQQLGVQNEPTVIYCTHESVRPGSCHGPVIRDVCVVECNLSGRGKVIINGTEFSFGPRQCYVLLPGDTVVQTSDVQEPRSGIYCTLDGLELPRHFHEAGITAETPFVSQEFFDEMLAWLEEMRLDIGRKDAGAPMRQASRIYGMLGVLLRGKSATKGDDLVKKAVGLMESNYPNALDMTSIASHVGLERSYFSVMFKEKTGMSPYQYLTALRLRKARILLRETDTAVASVAEAVGMDARNFARLFKKETGNTPLQYRAAHRKE